MTVVYGSTGKVTTLISLSEMSSMLLIRFVLKEIKETS